MEHHTHPDVYLYRNIWNELNPDQKTMLCARLSNLSYYAWLVRQGKPLWFRPFDLTAASVAVMYLTANYTAAKYLRKTNTTLYEAAAAMQEYLDGAEPTTIVSELVAAAMVAGAGNVVYEGRERVLWRLRQRPNTCKLPIVSENIAYLDGKGAVLEQHHAMRNLCSALEATKPYANANDDYLPQVILWQ